MSVRRQQDSPVSSSRKSERLKIEPEPTSTSGEESSEESSDDEGKTDEQLVDKYILRPLSKDSRNLVALPCHTSSAATRGPSEYDLHLIASHRLVKIVYNPSVLPDLRSAVKAHYLQRVKLLKMLRQKLCEPGFISTIHSLYDGTDKVAINECTITNNEGMMFKMATIAATHALFDLGKKDLKRQSLHPNFFECLPEPEPETKADLLLGLARLHWFPPAGTIKKFLDLISKLPFISGAELKNIFAGNPRVFNAILLLAAVMLQVQFPWPQTVCKSCTGFPLAHGKLLNASQILKPLDASTVVPPVAMSNAEELKEAITVVQEFIPVWDRIYGRTFAKKEEEYNKFLAKMDVDKADKLNTPEKPASKDTSPKRQSMPRKAKEGGESTTDWEKQLRLVEEAVSKVFDTYNVDLALRPKLNKWLRHAINLTIQSWSQMVRHDLTYHLVSSSEVAWVIHRHRKCQTASISGFFHPRDQPLLTHTGLVIRSYEDALVRLQEEKCSRTWVDPCRRHQQQEPKRREGDPDDHEKDERDNRRSGKRASNADPLPSAQGSQGGHSLSISELHLAFNWECLQSEGFSHMTRVIATDPPIEAGTMTTSTSDGSVKTSSSHGTVSSVPSLTMSTSQIASPLPVTPLDGSFASAQSEVLDMIGVESTSTSGKEVAVTISANEDESEAAVLDVQHASTHMFSKAGVVLDSLVANTSIGRVWSGNMVVEGLGQEKRVIVKMTTTDEGSEPILKEARIYEHLASQSIIPADAQYYGVFRSDNNSTALVLDDLGDALESFNHCSEEQKNALFDTALALHNSGVCHNDIEPRNVVVDQDGKVHIIDFHLATSDHSCPGADICGELTVLRNQLWLSH